MKAHLLTRNVARSLWRDWIRPLALPVLLITSAKSAIADINYVPSGSMKPTIVEGDVLFIDKLAYDLRVPFTFQRVARWSDPARGDIVVCFAPDDGTRLVKRVVALPGDTVELRHGALMLNGVPQAYTPLPEEKLRALSARERQNAIYAREEIDGRGHAVMAGRLPAGGRDFGPVRVPPGHYFVLGDNRDNSKDSRMFGFVARREIIGQARAVVASADCDRWLQPRLERFFSRLE